MLNRFLSEFIYNSDYQILSLPGISLKKKNIGKDYELSIQRQDTVGDILIDNLKPDAFKNGFLKRFVIQ